LLGYLIEVFRSDATDIRLLINGAAKKGREIGVGPFEATCRHVGDIIANCRQRIALRPHAERGDRKGRINRHFNNSKILNRHRTGVPDGLFHHFISKMDANLVFCLVC